MLAIPDPVALAVSGAIIFAAAVLRGFSGFGFALAAVPLLSMILPPSTSVATVIVMQALAGPPDLLRSHRKVDRPSLIRLSLGAAVGTPIGLALLALLSPNTVRLAIAGTLAIAVAILAVRPQETEGRFKALAVPAGLLSGLFSGMAGMPGPPAVAFYLVNPLSPDVVRSSLVVFFGFTSLLAVPGLAIAGLLDAGTALGAVCGLPLLFLGTSLGGRLLLAVPGSIHRGVALLVLTVTAVVTAVRGMTG